VTEYLAVCHDGYAGEKSRRLLADIAHKAGMQLTKDDQYLLYLVQTMMQGRPPATIEYKKSGKFFTVLQRTWT
jgi:hypothetical protein